MSLIGITEIYNGTGSFTASANTQNLFIECLGGGGGGGGSFRNGAAGGGGGGGYSTIHMSKSVWDAAAGDRAFTCSVGAGGAGGSGGDLGAFSYNTGSAGGNTSIGSGSTAAYALAFGGAGGQGSAAPAGGAGGNTVLATGSLLIAGGSGSVGFGFEKNDTQNAIKAGDGGDSQYGVGGIGPNSIQVRPVGQEILSQQGVGYGAGGSGATSGSGAAGTAGLIRVWEFSGGDE